MIQAPCFTKPISSTPTAGGKPRSVPWPRPTPGTGNASHRTPHPSRTNPEVAGPGLHRERNCRRTRRCSQNGLLGAQGLEFIFLIKSMLYIHTGRFLQPHRAPIGARAANPCANNTNSAPPRRRWQPPWPTKYVLARTNPAISLKTQQISPFTPSPFHPLSHPKTPSFTPVFTPFSPRWNPSTTHTPCTQPKFQIRYG